MSNAKRIIRKAYKLLRKDDELLRLLYYPPQRTTDDPDPLSKELDDIVGKPIDEYWDIVDNHILLTSKSDDLEKNAICRIYVYTGKIKPSFRNKLTIKQEIVIDVFVHHMYEVDQRLEMIADQLSDVLFSSRVGGLGTVDYRDGYDFTAPKGYQAYRHIYLVGGVK